jgi:hypothetical protein
MGGGLSHLSVVLHFYVVLMHNHPDFILDMWMVNLI